MPAQISRNQPKTKVFDQPDHDEVKGSFRLVEGENGKWSLVDQNQQIVFSGTIDDCQSWLDRDENNHSDLGFWSFVQSLLRNEPLSS